MSDSSRMSLKEKGLLREIGDKAPALFSRREIHVDNVLIDSFFSNSDVLFSEKTKEFGFEEQKKIDEINYIINHMIPEIERQIVYLLFFMKKSQEVVGKLLKISQEMVHYYKKRALKRIKIHYFFRTIDIEEMDAFLQKHVTKKQRIAMLEYFKGHDLRKIAKEISKIEGRSKPILYEAIGSRIKLGLKKLKALSQGENEDVKDKAQLYYEIFTLLKKHNSLHHTQSKKKFPQEIYA